MEREGESLSQAEKFKQVDRELERDDDEAAFDEKLKRVAKASRPATDSTQKGERPASKRMSGLPS
jgi:hypothetical protein